MNCCETIHIYIKCLKYFVKKKPNILQYRYNFLVSGPNRLPHADRILTHSQNHQDAVSKQLPISLIM